MNELLVLDLGRWEAGDLPLYELEARHPEAGVADLTDLWNRLSEAGQEPVADADRGWAAVSARLPERRRERTAGAWGTRRRAMAALVAALLCVGSAAFAVGPSEVRDAVGGAISQLVHLFRPDQSKHRGPLPPPPSSAHSPAARAGSGPAFTPRPSVQPPTSPTSTPRTFQLQHERDGEGEAGHEHRSTPEPESTEEPSNEPSSEPAAEPTAVPTDEVSSSPSPDSTPTPEPTSAETPTPSPTS